MRKVTGNISPIGKIDGVIKTSANSTVTGNITYGVGTGSSEYEGTYTVIPQAFQDITLSTKDKKLIEDIVIKEIPYYETSNTSGGNTVYIAGQIEFY